MNVRTLHTMGTVLNLHSPTPVSDAGFAALRATFTDMEDRFSHYRPGTEASLVATGALALDDTSDAFQDVYAQAVDWSELTKHRFDPHRPDGVVDLDGIVKALSIAAAAEDLREHGAGDWLLGVGNDLLCSGSNQGAPWEVTVADPIERTSQLCTVHLGESLPAIATSGTAERGNHIWGLTGNPDEFAQVTVLAADIVTADVLATAIFAGGENLRDFVTDRWPVGVLTVTVEGELAANRRFSSNATLRPSWERS